MVAAALLNFTGGNAQFARSSCSISGGILKIQEWLGHSDISTTSNIYTHLDYNSKVASANAIMGFFPT